MRERNQRAVLVWSWPRQIHSEIQHFVSCELEPQVRSGVAQGASCIYMILHMYACIQLEKVMSTSRMDKVSEDSLLVLAMIKNLVLDRE